MKNPYWQELARQFRNVLFEEQACFMCGKTGAPLCESCQQTYFPRDLDRCQGCGKLIALSKTLCEDCTEGRGPKGLHKVSAWGHYTGAWRQFIWDVKFNAKPYLLGKIAKPFADWAIDQLPVPDILIPVPASEERLLERGFNQAEVLASTLKWHLAVPIVNGLQRIYDTPSQVNLTRRERLINLEGVFMASSSYNFKHKKIWLVDDVTTTGATLEHCAHALLARGAKEIYGLCLAAGIEKRLVSSEK